MILDLMTRQFPPKLPAVASSTILSAADVKEENVKAELGTKAGGEVKSESRADAGADPTATANNQNSGVQTGIKREAGHTSRGGPDPKKSKMG
jgi:hypothetical protein